MNPPQIENFMKTVLRPMLVAFILMATMLSCNKEEAFVEPTAETPVDTPTDSTNTDGTTPPEDTVDPVADSTTPCDFTLDGIQAGDTVVLDCVLDLQGQTINLPPNVTIVYEGGDITNGTLNFADSSVISGELLNSSLTLSGSTPQVKDPTFTFNPQRWGIVEGKVSDEVAYNNKIIINEVMQQVKDLGVSTIKIDSLDAYFNVKPIAALKEHTQEAAIQVPSDINLVMTNNTHLRTQPNDYKNSTLMILFETDNTVVDGGFLHGDRDTHDYSDGGTHEWGHLIAIRGSKNATIKNVTMMDAGGDNISIHAYGHTFDPYYRYSENVLIQNNKMIRSRRNGMAITDGRDIIIEGNEFIDTGISTALSEGTAPMWAMDFEAVENNGIKYEIVDRVIVRNNIERGSEKGGFIIARGDHITFENNTMESTISINETVGSIVRNNTFENPTKSTVAIYAGMNDPRGYGNERSHDNQVYGNTIIGFDKGIFLQDPGIDLHDNTMTNCGSGILIKNTRDSKIRNNTIISDQNGSEGIGTHYPDYVNNLIISDNNIQVKGSPFRLTQVNTSDATIGFKITIENNEVTSLGNAQTYIQETRGFDFKNNLCHNSGIRTIDASLGNVLNNTFENGVIRISKGCSDLNFTGNTITGGQCFYEDNTDAINIVRQNNTCD